MYCVGQLIGKLMNKSILICVDHKWRDLPGYVYLGMHLEKKNIKVYYCRNGYERFFVELYNPSAVIFNGVWTKTQEAFTKHLHSKKIQVFIIPTEGISILKDSIDHSAFVHNDLSCVEKIFCWNEKSKIALKKNKTISNQNVINAGVLRFDFYTNPVLKKTILSREKFLKKYGLNPDKKTILIATNFSAARFVGKQLNHFQHDAKAYGYEKVITEAVGSLERMAYIDYTSREILLESIIRLNNKYADINFAVKLHPSEDHSFYKNYFKSKNIKKISLISNEIIWDILYNVDLEINRSCTTAFESWLLNKPTIEFRLNPEEYYKSEAHSCGSIIAKSQEELENAVELALREPDKFTKQFAQIRNMTLSEFCGELDGEVTKKIAITISESLSRQNQVQNNKNKLVYKVIARILISFDWFLHDIKYYGVYSTITREYKDYLGRYDKMFHFRDIRFWRKRIEQVGEI